MPPILLSVKDNTAPAFTVTLKRNGVVINLVGAQNVKCYLTDAQLRAQTNTGHETCSIVDAVNGVVSYTPQAGDIGDGRFFAEFGIVNASGSTERLHEILTVVGRVKTT